MNDNNSENNQNTNLNNYVDPRNVNAEVIGELRKDKIGKPMLAIEMGALFLVILIALPIVSNMLNDENSFLYKIIYGSTGTEIIDTPVVKEEFLNGGVEQPLASGTVMKFENIVMQDFSLKGSNIICDMYSYNGVLNLDESEYYLEVYSSSSSNLIAAVKLTGTYDRQVKEVTLTANDLSFNANYSYVGKIVEMKDADYPSVTINSDESGIGSFVCKKDNRELTYTFKNNYLIGIKDYYKVYLVDQENSTAYLNLKGTYEDKASKLGSVAVVEEEVDGFIFNADINLETMMVPTTIVDYEYYKLDTEAKVIHYALEGKGFDCE